MPCDDCPDTRRPDQPAWNALPPRLRPVVSRLEMLRERGDPEMQPQIEAALAVLLPTETKAAPQRPLVDHTFSCPQCGKRFRVDVAQRAVRPVE